MSATLAARLPEFNGQDMVFTAFACSRLRGVDDTLPHAIAAEMEARGVTSFKVRTHGSTTPRRMLVCVRAFGLLLFCSLL